MKRYLAPAVCAVLALLIAPGSALAQSDTATCGITVTVDAIVEWDAAAFTAIGLANITAQGDQPTGTSSLVLYTNGDVDLTADNDTDAQLSSATDALVTEYQLTDDGDGTSGTGMVTDVTTWTDYTTFLSPAVTVTHVSTDGAVNITLGVRASNPAGEVADTGAYSATQTLTATWAGP